ncbi:VWA domain-containing protein [Endozoicomonas arenosclerae]|uniref:VWA domain-containing protein n=1 Tax=Endozoicomonas arenosclerae TaxID=1633495 RepID=UPI0009A1679A|nr:VWA domain-containing protein [Endozoicomonas arenosclerae]
MAPVLQRALPIVGSALGRKMGVRVEVAGNKACTDGECIWIPAFDLQRPEQEALCWGFLCHEAAHVRYTDFNLDYKGSTLRHRLTNLLEDIRIEKAISQEYPGAAFSLAEVVRQLVAKGRLGAPKKSDSPVKVLNDSLLAILRLEVLGQKALEQESTKAREVMKTCFSKQLLDSLNGLLKQVPGLKSTKEALNLAEQIIALFQNLSNDHSENKDSGEIGSDKPESSSESQGTDSRQPESQDQEDKTDSVSGAELESDSEEGGNDHPENLSGSDNQIVSKNGDASDKAEDPFLKQILESTDQDWPDDLFETVAGELESWSCAQSSSLSAITTTPGLDDVVTTDEDKRAAKVLLWKVQSESARLAAQLTGLVQAKILTRDRTGKRGIRIEGKRLHRMALDDGRLFKRRAESITVNATVHISLDISSSMAPRMKLAREAVLSLVFALKQINGVTVSASAYPGTRDDRVFPIITGKESTQAVAVTLEALDSHDSTPMTTGLWHAVHQVCQAEAERRLILMITDGTPDIDHHDAVVNLVSRCQQSGINVVGIGINVLLDENLFPKRLKIGHVGELKTTLFDLARHWLVD